MVNKNLPATQADQQAGQQDGHRGDDATIELLKYLFDPTRERMPELTDIPLNQVDPLTWIITFEQVARSLMEYMKYVKAKRQWDRNGQSGEPPKRPEVILASEVWRHAFYQHRRSIEGSGKMMASTLAMKQLEIAELKEAEGDKENW